MVAHAFNASSNSEIELDSHADMHVVGDNCLVVLDHNRPVNVYSYDSKDGHRSAKTVQLSRPTEWSNIAICIDGLVNHLIFPMQCCLNRVHISEVPKFLAKTHNETMHVIELVEPFDAAHPLLSHPN